MMKKLQNLGKAIMQPVAILPVAALLMGIGYWIDSSGSTNNIIAAFLNKTGGAILGNLGIIFAVGIAFLIELDGLNGIDKLQGYDVLTLLKM